MRYGLLGPLEVRDGDRLLPLGGPKQRAVLALLAVRANRVVSREWLIDGLWGEEPPETAVATVQAYVSRLRKLLPDGMLVRQAPGYVLRVDPAELDLSRVEMLLGQGRRALAEGAPEQARGLLHEALSLWRGPALAEFASLPFARAEAPRLEELRLATLEDRIDADLALGHSGELVGELEALVREEPLRERLRGQLILALYRSGRQAESLEAYREMQAALDELGLEPTASLRRLEREILTQDAALDLSRRVAAPGSFALPGPLVAVSAFPFVGRVDELREFRMLLERAEAGEGGTVLLAGQAGGGKTRLVREIAQEAAARGVLVLHGASDATVTTPYQPVREWLGFLLHVYDPELLLECLGGRNEVSRLEPELSRLTGMPAPPAGDPESDSYLLQGAVTELVGRLSRVQPLLLIADDIHWADSETLQLLRRLTHAAPEARFLLVTAFRDRGEEISPALTDTLADLSRLDSASRITLDRLTTGEVNEFIETSTGVTAPEELAPALEALTGGMPLLLCELWRDLLESGDVEVAGDGVRLARPAGELRSPERIRDVVRQRLTRLSADAGTLLELAAVAGPTFTLPLIDKAIRLDHGALQAAVEETSAGGMIEPSGTSFRFTHELVRRAVYDRITGARLAQLHLRVGEALEQLHEADPSVALPELAHHFTISAPLAGSERAIDYNLRAAERALGLDTGEALLLLERARALTRAGDPLFPLVLLRWGEVASHAGRLREAAEALDQAADSFEARGDALRAGEALTALGNIRRLLAEPGYHATLERAIALLEPVPGPELVAALAVIADDQRMSGDNEGAVGASDRALTLAAQLDLPIPGFALGGRGLSRASLGDAGGFDDIEHALELFVAAGQGRDAAWLLRQSADRRCWFEGPATSLARYERAEAFAAERGLADEEQGAAGHRVRALVEAGRLGEALQLAAALVPLLRKSGNRQIEHEVLAHQARALAERGEDAREPVERELQILRDGDLQPMSPWSVVVALVAAGDTAAVRALLDMAVKAPHRRGAYSVSLAVLARAGAATGDLDLIGPLAADVPEALPVAQHGLVTVSAIHAEGIGEYAQAASLYADAAERWHGFTAVLEEAYALLGQGRCLTVVGDPKAVALLHAARRLFDQMGARPRVGECDDLLARATLMSSNRWP